MVGSQRPVQGDYQKLHGYMYIYALQRTWCLKIDYVRHTVTCRNAFINDILNPIGWHNGPLLARVVSAHSFTIQCVYIQSW